MGRWVCGWVDYKNEWTAVTCNKAETETLPLPGWKKSGALNGSLECPRMLLQKSIAEMMIRDKKAPRGLERGCGTCSRVWSLPTMGRAR